MSNQLTENKLQDSYGNVCFEVWYDPELDAYMAWNTNWIPGYSVGDTVYEAIANLCARNLSFLAVR